MSAFSFRTQGWSRDPKPAPCRSEYDLKAVSPLAVQAPLLKQPAGVYKPEVEPSFLVRNPLSQFPNMEFIIDIPEAFNIREPLLVGLSLSRHPQLRMGPICKAQSASLSCRTRGIMTRHAPDPYRMLSGPLAMIAFAMGFIVSMPCSCPWYSRSNPDSLT